MTQPEPNERLTTVLDYIKSKEKLRHEHDQKDKKPAAYCIYIVQCKEFVKIGLTNNVEKRISEMMTGNPFPVKLLKSVHSLNPYEDERRLHARLYRYHHQGEWYKIPKRMLNKLLLLDEASLSIEPSRPVPRSYLYRHKRH